MKTSVAELSTVEQQEIERRMDELEPRVLPAEWRKFGDFANARHFLSRDKLKVFQEVEFIDGAHWLHVSFSRPDKIPTYFDMTRVKALFVGRKRKAVQVLPAEEEHVNDNTNVLHLFSPLDADPLPDFRYGGSL